MTRSSRIEEQAKATLSDPRWPSIVARDGLSDGKFYYAVTTTGVYCRPSCAARLTRPENMRYFENGEAVQEAGFRPCKRCKSDQASIAAENANKIAKACRLIEKSEEVPSLAALAKDASMSTYHFHRTFKTIMGLTPNDYAASHRGQRVRNSLKRSVLLEREARA